MDGSQVDMEATVRVRTSLHAPAGEGRRRAKCSNSPVSAGLQLRAYAGGRVQPTVSRGHDRRIRTRTERGARFDSRHRKVFGSNFPEYTSSMRRIALSIGSMLHPGPKHYKSTVLFDCHLYFAWKDSGRARWVQGSPSRARLQPQHGRNGGQHIEFFRLHRPIKLRLCA